MENITKVWHPSKTKSKRTSITNTLISSAINNHMLSHNNQQPIHKPLINNISNTSNVTYNINNTSNTHNNNINNSCIST
jgi:hypothetical protein